jgi:hypothetical protein
MAFWKRREEQGDTGAKTRAALTSPTRSEGDSEIVDLGCQLRDAIEQREMGQARTIAKKYKAALEKAGKWGALGDVAALDPCVGTALQLSEANDLVDVVGPERVEELRLIIALVYSLGLDYTDGVLAVVADLPAERLARWGRFAAERDCPTAMWDDVLRDDPAALPLVEAASSLTFDARSLLAFPKLLRRRMAVSRQHLVRRTFMNPQRVDAALEELTEAGYASPATPLDKLATLTVEQLSPLAAETDAPKSGSKARKLRAIGEQVEEAIIERHLQGFPKASGADIAIGAGMGKTAKFHESWARLIGHYLFFVSSARERQQSYLEGRADGLQSGYEFRTSGAPDSCDLCASEPCVDLEDFDTWPPFHLGCRCSVYAIPPSSSLPR